VNCTFAVQPTIMTGKRFESSIVNRQPSICPCLLNLNLLFVLLSLVLSLPSAALSSTPAPADVRKQLEDSIGRIPWTPASGYRLSGQFTLKITGEEIAYQAAYLRLPQAWAADFTQADHTRNMRYGSAPQAWASSPEVTVDVGPEQLPFCAQYDFPLLYSELLRVLAAGERGPEFRLGSDGYEVMVRGRLWNGLQATFILHTSDYYLKKVSLSTKGEVQPAWLIPISEANGLVFVDQLPAGKAERFEVWFSQFSDAGGYKYPRRTDYMAQAGAAASFILDSAEPPKGNETPPERPPDLPWFNSVSFQPSWDLHRPSLYLGVSDLPRFRARLRNQPWRDWRQANMLAAAWGSAVFRLDQYVPSFSSPLSLSLLLAVSMLAYVWLLRRRFRTAGRKVPLKWFAPGAAIWLAVLLSGIAQMQLGAAATRSLIALHVATRYAVTGSSAHAATARELLLTLPESNPPRSLSMRADACRAYALAYDLISPTLARDKQAQVENNLFQYAAPLYGALQGWRASSAAGSRLAAGLGMAGLAIGSEEYVGAARQAMENLLKNQLSGGLHREGPGPGAAAMDVAADFFFALKHAGRADYYRSEPFQDYVRTTLLLTSPVGTLPLFEGTGLDHSIHAIPFLLKAVNRVPNDLGYQCIAAYEAYWRTGRYSTSGFSKLLVDLAQPEWYFLANPYTLFEYEEPEPAGGLPAASAVLADGQCAILRAGRGKNSVYLALNARRSLATEPARDALAFDLYAYNSLLLHGPGMPRPGSKGFPLATQTLSANCVTFNDTSQTGTQSTGVVAALLNQPLFDYFRALADRAYDQGQMQRDVILIRPDQDHAAYFLLIDEVRAIDSRAKVQWHLHGRGELKIGVDKLSRWSMTAFEPPALRSTELLLTAYPIGQTGRVREEPGTLYFENPFYDQKSQTMIMEWNGSSRFCTALMPRTASMPEAAFNPVPDLESCRIGTTDWVSFGTPETRIRVGPMHHASEYVVVRERGISFPALLMVGGIEFSMGPHSLASNKPIFVSLDGLQGSVLNFRPETRVELRSPEIEPGKRFQLDGKDLAPGQSGKLILSLDEPGEHHLRQAP